MNLKKYLIAGALAFLGLSTAVLSQNIVPTVPVGGIHLNSDLIQIVPFGVPSSQSVYATPAQLAGTFGYYKSPASAPATAFTYTFGASVTYASFTPTGTLAAGYVTLPAAPQDGQRACVFTTQTITAFYVAANTGQSITNAGGFSSGSGVSNALSANAGACWTYGASNTTWDRT